MPLLKLFFTVFLFGATTCAAQDSSAKIVYTFSPDVADDDKALFTVRADKGKILYKIHCADCHGIFTKGKDSIPNFSKQQIDNYNARALMGFRNHLTVRKLSYDQVDYIITFLRLRKPDQ